MTDTKPNPLCDLCHKPTNGDFTQERVYRFGVLVVCKGCERKPTK